MPSFIDISALQEFSIVEFLARLGHQPVRKIGRDHFYHSMLRETQRNTPSLTVWDSAGKWKDWGGANQSNIAGGGIIQLGMAFWPGLPYVDLLHKISEVCNLDPMLIPEYIPPLKYPTESEEAGFRFELVKTKPIGSNFVLTQYLQSRGIIDVASPYLSEIYYQDRSKSDDQRTFYAIGWQNEHQNWEFSNAKGFKSSTGAKGISVISGSSNHAILFEGYMDFLTWLKVHRPAFMPTVIVLNSITLLSRAISLIKDFSVIDIYFDHDGPGRKCTSQLKAEVPQAVDRSNEYLGYKDFNEKLTHERQRLNLPEHESPEELQAYKIGRNR